MGNDNKLIKKFEDDPILRFLIQIAGGTVPFVSAFDDALRARIDNIQRERLNAFFEELAFGEIELTEEVVQSEDFLHAYFSTVKAVVNTRRQEKIKLFAHLFENYAKNIDRYELDDFEEWLSLLDEISYKEFGILVTLRRYEIKHQVSKSDNEQALYAVFWDEFVAEIRKNFSVPPNELASMLARITRTGLYGNIPTDDKKIYGVTYFDSTAHLTPLFNSFIKALGHIDREMSTDSP